MTPEVMRSRGENVAVRPTVTRVAVLLAACVGFIAPPVFAAETGNVLVLYSHNRLQPANVEIDRGLREVVSEWPDRRVELFAEYLDMPAFSGAEYEQSTARFLREKYAARPPRVVLVVAELALEFMLHHRGEVFSGVPVVHLSVSANYLRSMSALPADVVGIPVSFDAMGTVRLAIQLHPDAQRLIVVTGTSAFDRARESDARAGIPKLQLRQTVEFLAGQPTDAVKQRLAALGKGDVVYTPGYFQDGTGRNFSPADAAAILAPASAAPLYGPYVSFLGTGAVGGRMPDNVEMGRQAAKTVGNLLDGAPITSIRLPESIPARTQLDWRQVRRWGIAERDIPDDAILNFKEPTFWETYRKQAIGIAAVFLLQAALIAALLVERRLRRKTASALEESERRISLAARAARLSMWIWDVNRDKVGANPKWPQGSPSKESPVDLDEVLDTVHPADRERFDRAVRRAVARDEELDVEYRMLLPGGEVRWIAARGRAEKGDGERLMGVALDITARKAAEQQAESDRAALTHMTRVSMMGQLSASIAHQLNQPLAAILGNAEAARKMLDRTQLDLLELREICDDIVTEDIRAAEVIRRLGALYKRGELTLAPLDLNDLVHETLDLVRTELMNRHVVPVIELEATLPAVDGGRVQLQQVLLNLILNAADAMSDTEPARRTVSIRTDLVGPNVRLCVADQGTGIAPGDLNNVFDAFWSTKVGGIGVGLAVCKSIVSAHRGTLTAANNPDGGATFCAAWPVRKAG